MNTSDMNKTQAKKKIATRTKEAANKEEYFRTDLNKEEGEESGGRGRDEKRITSDRGDGRNCYSETK